MSLRDFCRKAQSPIFRYSGQRCSGIDVLSCGDRQSRKKSRLRGFYRNSVFIFSGKGLIFGLCRTALLAGAPAADGESFLVPKAVE